MAPPLKEAKSTDVMLHIFKARPHLPGKVNIVQVKNCPLVTHITSFHQLILCLLKGLLSFWPSTVSKDTLEGPGSTVASVFEVSESVCTGRWLA